MGKTSIGVIGVGALGERHARIYCQLPEATLEAICDINPDKVDDLARQLRIKPYYDYTRLPLKQLRAVSICVPTQGHYETARFFLERGIHVLVEKPFTTTLSQAEELIQIAKKNHLVLQVGHIERFNSAFQAIEPVVREPKFIECHRLSLFPNRSLDVGAVLDIMIHDIDILLGLVTAEVISLDAIGVKVLTNFEDIANARIKFHNGCIANLTASRISDETMRKIRIFLPDAYISLDYLKQEGYIYRKINNHIDKQIIPIEKEQPLQKELASFIDCVRNKRVPVVTGEKAKAALALALTIIQKIHG